MLNAVRKPQRVDYAKPSLRTNNLRTNNLILPHIVSNRILEIALNTHPTLLGDIQGEVTAIGLFPRGIGCTNVAKQTDNQCRRLRLANVLPAKKNFLRVGDAGLEPATSAV
jgi:hypothetical protein